jgi:hypothetical protein
VEATVYEYMNNILTIYKFLALPILSSTPSESPMSWGLSLFSQMRKLRLKERK